MPRPPAPVDATAMRGRVCLVTGATSGIGRVTAAELARRGATVIIVSRDPDRGRRTLDEMRTAIDRGSIELEVADLERQSDVRALAARVAARHERLHVLVNNAGAIFMERRVTPDGIEATLALNHLAPFLLTKLLLDRLRAGAPARVVTVSSEMHRLARLDLDDPGGARRYSGVGAYAVSKLMNILFTTELARRLEGSGVVANAVHPGGVDTGIWRRVRGYRRLAVALMRPFLMSPERGATGIVWLATEPGAAAMTGLYLVRGRPARPSAAARDPGRAARLWTMSDTMTESRATAGGGT